ncbi:MAG: 4-hydroxyphenylpyruvate dioxygenase, partial [Runella slithyformis]
MATATEIDRSQVQDLLPLNGTDYVEFYVGNAKQAAFFYEKMFGFEIVAYCGPETGVRDRASYLVQQGKIRLVFTAAMKGDSDIAEHVRKHGDGVKTLALWVDNAEAAFYNTLSRGATAVAVPQTLSDEYGSVVQASIATYGDTVHTFVERKNYRGVFLPNYKPYKSKTFAGSVGLQYIDHCVGNVEMGEMNRWVKFYEEVMGFKLLLTFDDKDISTDYSALMSKVVSNGNGYVKFPINEPADGKRKSQVEEYLDFYNGAGVQHIAVATHDIIHAVTELRARGVEFLEIPASYYDELLGRVGKIDEDLTPLKELNILVDRDEEGYLLQIFTEPVEDRPTLFFEII